MKSPISRVGIIDAEGIRNGSATNDRKRRTTKKIGKKERAVSTINGSFVMFPASVSGNLSSIPLLRPGANFQASTAQIKPLLIVKNTSKAEKSKFISFILFSQHINIILPCPREVSP